MHRIGILFTTVIRVEQSKSSHGSYLMELYVGIAYSTYTQHTYLLRLCKRRRPAYSDDDGALRTVKFFYTQIVGKLDQTIGQVYTNTYNAQVNALTNMNVMGSRKFNLPIMFNRLFSLICRIRLGRFYSFSMPQICNISKQFIRSTTYIGYITKDTLQIGSIQS